MNHHIKFILNDRVVEFNCNPATVLLDYIRKEKHLTGTKEVCKEGDCGACAVIIGSKESEVVKYKLINSCLYPLGNVNYSHVITVEGLNIDGFTAIQQKFIDEGASQCGFCTPGFIVAFTSYLLGSENYNLTDAIDALGGNICRCTGYMSIKRSVEKIIKYVKDNWNDALSKTENLVLLKILPEYFNTLHKLILEIEPTEEKNISTYDYNKIVSGGTDLFVQSADELLNDEIAFGNNYKNNKIEELEVEIVIGGQVTFEQFNQSDIINKYFPEINKYMFLIASLPIRNSATIAGNLVNASPIGDMTIFLLGLDSRIVLVNKLGSRRINLKDFYLGYKKLDKSKDEIVKEIRFNKATDGFYFNFEKVSKRVNLDIASVNSSISLKLDGNKIVNGHLAFGGVSPVPIYLTKTSEMMNESEVNAELLDTLILSAQKEISPISDIRGSEEYKRLLVSQMIKKHFLKLFPEVISEEVVA